LIYDQLPRPKRSSLELQLFAKTLATALVEKNNLRDHEK